MASGLSPILTALVYVRFPTVCHRPSTWPNLRLSTFWSPVQQKRLWFEVNYLLVDLGAYTLGAYLTASLQLGECRTFFMSHQGNVGFPFTKNHFQPSSLWLLQDHIEVYVTSRGSFAFNFSPSGSFRFSPFDCCVLWSQFQRELQDNFLLAW